MARSTGRRGKPEPTPTPAAPPASLQPADIAAHRLAQWRQWRGVGSRDPRRLDIQPWFDRAVARPYKQLHGLVEAWQTFVPSDWLEHTRLDSLVRGVLHVVVDSSALLYEMDQTLRHDLLASLRQQCPDARIRRVKLTVGPVAPPPASPRRSEAPDQGGEPDDDQ